MKRGRVLEAAANVRVNANRRKGVPLEDFSTDRAVKILAALLAPHLPQLGQAGVLPEREVLAPGLAQAQGSVSQEAGFSILRSPNGA
jgi:hypothetical protein